MLPFVVAASHHNYIYSLPICQYVVRKKAGSIKGVTSDMAHGETYNRDVKEKNYPGC